MYRSRCVCVWGLITAGDLFHLNGYSQRTIMKHFRRMRLQSIFPKRLCNLFIESSLFGIHYNMFDQIHFVHIPFCHKAWKFVKKANAVMIHSFNKLKILNEIMHNLARKLSNIIIIQYIRTCLNIGQLLKLFVTTKCYVTTKFTKHFQITGSTFCIFSNID